MVDYPFSESQYPAGEHKKGKYDKACHKMRNYFSKDIDINYFYHRYNFVSVYICLPCALNRLAMQKNFLFFLIVLIASIFYKEIKKCKQ